MAESHRTGPDWVLLDGQGFDWSWAYRDFRPIPGWPGYLADSDGWLWSSRKAGRKGGFHDHWRPLTLKPSPHGYRQAQLCHFGVMRHVQVHHVILEAFLGPRPPGMFGRHLNDTPWDNRIQNLAWGTPKQNTHDSIRNGTFARGSRQPSAKLHESQIPVIRELIASGKTHESISTTYQVSRELISQIAQGRKWKGVV